MFLPREAVFALQNKGKNLHNLLEKTFYCIKHSVFGFRGNARTSQLNTPFVRKWKHSSPYSSLGSPRNHSFLGYTSPSASAIPNMHQLCLSGTSSRHRWWWRRWYSIATSKLRNGDLSRRSFSRLHICPSSRLRTTSSWTYRVSRRNGFGLSLYTPRSQRFFWLMNVSSRSRHCALGCSPHIFSGESPAWNNALLRSEASKNRSSIVPHSKRDGLFKALNKNKFFLYISVVVSHIRELARGIL